MTVPAVFEVSKLMLMVYGTPRPTAGQTLHEATDLRRRQFERWLARQGVTVSKVGVRRVVYLSALRAAWPELYESMAIAGRAVCEQCGEVPSCPCRRRVRGR